MLERKTVDFIKGFLEAEFEDFNSKELTSLKEQVVNFGFKPFNNETEFYNLKRYFKGMLDAEHITLKVDETTSKVIKCDAYESLVELYPELIKVIDSCFADEYMDNIYIEEGISITFNTWEAGAPASFTYNFNGKLISYYNAELGGEISYEDETEIYFNDEKENDAMEATMNNTTVNETNETVNENMEGNEMGNNVNETAATTEEEVTMAQKAEAFANASKEKAMEFFKLAAKKSRTARFELKKMSNMNNGQLEAYIKKQGKKLIDSIVGEVKEHAEELKENSDIIPEFVEESKKVFNLIDVIKDILGETETTGWAKFVSIVKAVVRWLLSLLIKVGTVVLKIAFTATVGIVKISATALVTAGKIVGTVNKEIVKPTIGATKDAWANHKANAEERKARKAQQQEDFDEFEEELFDFDEDVTTEEETK